MFIVNLRTFGQNLSESEIDLLIDEYVEKKLNFNHKLHKMSEMMNRFIIIASDHAHIDTEVILQIVKGSKNIWTSAVSIVVNIAFKIFKHLEVALEDIKNYPKNTEYNMELMRYAGLLAKMFDAIYAASLDDPNDIFYQEEANDDIKRLIKSIKYHEPGDKDDHFRRFENFTQFFNFVMSVGVNALSHRNLWSVALSGLYNATYYKL